MAAEGVKTSYFDENDVLVALFKLADWPKNLDWMEPTQRVAYALGVFDDDEIATCDICSGSGRVDSSVNPDGPWCSCQKENGHVISLEAQIRIQEIFPEYEIR